MFDFLAGVLAFFYELWPSYGGAILLFTIAVMLVLSPLSIKSTRSMLALQRVGPDLKKLQQKHKGDRETLNKEMMAFYQENNINPLSSCLPLILQLPVFFVLYQVLLGLTRRSVSGDPTSTFNPKYFEGENTPLAVALRGANEMRSFGMDLSQSALGELQRDGLLVALPFIILIVLVGVAAWYQQRQITGRNPAANPQQQRIAKFIPFVFPAISVSIPAGVVVYFVVSSVVRIGQQAVVSKLEGGRAAFARAGPDQKKPEAKKPEAKKPEPKRAKKPEPKRAGAGRAGKRRERSSRAKAADGKRPEAKKPQAKAADGKKPEAKKPQAKGNERRERRADAHNKGDGAAPKDGGSNGARAGQASRPGRRSPGGQGRTGSQSGGSRSRSRKKRRK